MKILPVLISLLLSINTLANEIRDTFYNGTEDQIIKSLTSSQLYSDSINSLKETPLMLAIKLRKLRIIDFLLKEEQVLHEIHQENAWGENALSYALKAGDLKTTLTLSKYLQVKTLKNKKGQDALIMAILSGNSLLIKFIMKELGGDYRSKDKKGYDQFYYSALMDTPSVLNYYKPSLRELLEGVEENVFTLSSREGSLRVVSYLMEHYDGFHKISDRLGNTMIHSAILGQSIEIMNILLPHYSDLSIKNNSGFNAADLIEISSHSLMKENFILYAEKDKSALAFEFAKSGNFDEVISILKSHEVDLNYQNEFSQTMLMMAAKSNNFDLVSYLLNKGADKTVIDYFGNLAVDYTADTDIIYHIESF